jgi:hypothetical protein
MPIDNKNRHLAFLAILVLLAIAWTWGFNLHPVQAQTSAVPFDTLQVSVLSTATALAPANGNRTGLLLTNPGSIGVYIGNSASVTTSTGAFLPGGGSISLPTRAPVFAISSGATQVITGLETFEKLP